MPTKNDESTRFYSQKQENHIAKRFGGYRIANSGAGLFAKSDVVIKDASLSIECKTSLSEKSSFSVKKEWIKKHKDEAFSNRLFNTALAISFDPSGEENYYLIDEKLMSFLIEKLREENTE